MTREPKVSDFILKLYDIMEVFVVPINAEPLVSGDHRLERLRGCGEEY